PADSDLQGRFGVDDSVRDEFADQQNHVVERVGDTPCEQSVVNEFAGGRGGFRVGWKLSSCDLQRVVCWQAVGVLHRWARTVEGVITTIRGSRSPERGADRGESRQVAAGMRG